MKILRAGETFSTAPNDFHCAEHLLETRAYAMFKARFCVGIFSLLSNSIACANLEQNH